MASQDTLHLQQHLAVSQPSFLPFTCSPLIIYFHVYVSLCFSVGLQQQKVFVNFLICYLSSIIVMPHTMIILLNLYDIITRSVP